MSAADGSATTLYKSTGPDGRTIYSDVPPPQARDSKTLTFKNLPASPLSADTLAYVEQLRKSADARASATPPRDTVLFSAKWCGYESPRISWRLNTLRGLSHEEVEQVFTRGA
nr:DUF4124 domain-containing protein [Variovorax paradoxus]